jgi:hypothetical protein
MYPNNRTNAFNNFLLTITEKLNIHEAEKVSYLIFKGYISWKLPPT